MGTGLGPESYAIIEQGRIGQILSSKPQDRRAVIEEAAGITKYKTRKRLAEAKLESAKQNLARVFDILEEVTRQVNSLKRQAAKARRYARAEGGDGSAAAGGAFGQVPAAGARCGQDPRIDLNLAADRAEDRRRAGGARRKSSTRRVQAVCYETEQQLTETRRQLAEIERGGRAHARPAGIAGEGERRDRAAHRAGREANRRNSTRAWRSSKRSSPGTARRWRRSKRRFRRRARAHAGEEPAARGVAGAACASAKRPSKRAARRCCGCWAKPPRCATSWRRSTNTWPASSAKPRARSGKRRRPRPRSSGWTARKKSVSETLAQRQLELEAVAGERRRTEEELACGAHRATELRGQIDGAAARSARG